LSEPERALKNRGPVNLLTIRTELRVRSETERIANASWHLMARRIGANILFKFRKQTGALRSTSSSNRVWTHFVFRPGYSRYSVNKLPVNEFSGTSELKHELNKVKIRLRSCSAIQQHSTASDKEIC
jgi:hypothetical protein